MVFYVFGGIGRESFTSNHPEDLGAWLGGSYASRVPSRIAL